MGEPIEGTIVWVTYGGFQKLGVGVRSIVFWGLYWGTRI